jgi:3-hydroxyisobutyrate dehydrogenase-like beta-hydroxyacid dehydrogenase
MSENRWGIIGFGQVGYSLAKYLTMQTGNPVHVVDPLLLEKPLPHHIQHYLTQVEIQVANEIADLTVDCDCVLSVVTTRVAEDVAQKAGPVWQEGLYIDLNSSPPDAKRRASAHFPTNSYIDGAILGAIAVEGANTPIALAGGRAAEADALFRAVGMRTSVVGSKVGAASALKLCRSVFMKGLECLLIETLLAAGEFGITEPVLDTIQESIDSYTFRPLVQMLVTTHAVHCVRRAHEMEGAVGMLEGLNLPKWMSAAAATVLAESGRAGLPEHVGAVPPDDPAEVIQYLSDYYQQRISTT